VFSRKASVNVASSSTHSVRNMCVMNAIVGKRETVNAALVLYSNTDDRYSLIKHARITRCMCVAMFVEGGCFGDRNRLYLLGNIDYEITQHVLQVYMTSTWDNCLQCDKTCAYHYVHVCCNVCLRRLFGDSNRLYLLGNIDFEITDHVLHA
jgi:hypothetical protein